MKIVVGKLAGFCGGVTNSVTKSYKLLEEYGSMYCLGELVHNQQVVDELESKGIKFIESINEIDKSSKVIIRAHGVPSLVYETAKKKNIELFDLTCPNVLAIHRLAEDLVKENNFVVLVAQKEHPEAIGTISFCGDNSYIVESIDDIDNLIYEYNNSDLDKMAIICQTTFSVKKFNDICELIKDKVSNVSIHDTICSATSKRQEETEKLSSNVDAMIIIGGANSSNTKKLYDIANNKCKNTYIIQTVKELEDKKEILSNYETVGVMAGASTPKKSIDDVVKYLEDVNK